MAGLSLHDLHLEFCQEQVKSKQGGCVWHAALLQGYLEPSSDALCFDLCALSSEQIVALRPRPWWSDAIKDDGYIHGHLGASSVIVRWRFRADGCFIGREVDECTG